MDFFVVAFYMYVFYAKALIMCRQAEGKKHGGSRKLKKRIRLLEQWANPALPKLEANKHDLSIFTLLCLSTREML